MNACFSKRQEVIMAKGYCPECNATLQVGKLPRKGQRISCFKCGSDLEITNISPIELDWTLDEEGDSDTRYERGFDPKFRDV
jgi:transposase-like protein